MNGYITINLNGQPVGLKFAYPAIKAFALAMESKPDLYILSGDRADFTIEGMAKFIQCGYLNNCAIKEQEPTFTYKDFFDYVEAALEDSSRVEEIAKVFECYGQTVYAKRLAEAEEKKSATTTLLTES
jgi:hypothetical protein